MIGPGSPILISLSCRCEAHLARAKLDLHYRPPPRIIAVQTQLQELLIHRLNSLTVLQSALLAVECGISNAEVSLEEPSTISPSPQSSPVNGD